METNYSEEEGTAQCFVWATAWDDPSAQPVDHIQRSASVKESYTSVDPKGDSNFSLLFSYQQ